MATFKIKDRIIDQGLKPYIIAEMSGNHNQSFEHAIAIVDAAARVGACAVKLQTYTPDTITLNCDNDDFCIASEGSLWKGDSLYKLYQKAHTDWDWIGELIQHAESLGLHCFSSVFDESSIDFLEDLNVCAYKISSFENNHIPLIRKAASTGKPLIVSTGLATEAELDELIENVKEVGCEQYALLKCTSDYPANPGDSNILSIPYLQGKYGCQIGFSDHTLGIGVAIGSIALGATIIEKHFTDSRIFAGVDSEFSADESEFFALVKEANKVADALGEAKFGATANERKSLQFRRSIYVSESIDMGDVFSTKNIRVVRPGYGLHPRFYTKLLGKRSPKKLKHGDRLDASVLSVLYQAE